MPSATTYQAAINRLVELASPQNPGYIAVNAACKLVSELSPSNPRHHDIMRLLNADDPAPAADTDTADEDDEASTPQEDDEPL